MGISIKGLLQFLPRTEDSWVSLQLNYEIEDDTLEYMLEEENASTIF